MSSVSELTIGALKQSGSESMEEYASSLRQACKAHPPPFGTAWYGDKYRQVSCDPTWLANSLVSNAAKEGEGSRKLWALAGRAPEPRVAELIRRHAIDEARHAKLYISMLDITFPEAIDEALIPTLFSLSPGYKISGYPNRLRTSSDTQVLDEIIQMNIGEIRTRIHQLLLRPVILAHCSPERRLRLMRVLDSLLSDETQHIRYTARLIEEAIGKGRGNFVRATMSDRLEEFNHITLDEVGGLAFDGA